MVKKSYAYLKTTSDFEYISVYEAIRRKSKWIKNRDEEMLFYDMPNVEQGELLFPKKTSIDGKSAHFAYYPGSKHIGLGSEKTKTHEIYEVAIRKMKKIKLYIFGKEVVLYIKRAYPNYYIKTKNNYYLLDVYVILEKTEPRSYFYKWGGKIAIEIYVTHKVESSKANDLEETKIQIFELKIYENNYITKNITNEEEFNLELFFVMEKIRKEKNVGRFVNDVYPPKQSKWEKRYLTMKDFERDVEEIQGIMEKNKEQLELQNNEIKEKRRQIECLESKEQDIEKKIQDKKKELVSIEKRILKIEELEKKNYILGERIKELEKSVEKEKNAGILKKVSNLIKSMK